MALGTNNMVVENTLGNEKVKSLNLIFSKWGISV